LKLRVKGQAALYLAATILALVSLCVKLASRYYSPLFVSASRFLLGAVFCVVTLSLGFPGTKPKRIGAVILRGFFGSLAMITSYAAVSLTGPGRATLLANTYPLFVAFFGALLFGEKVGARTFASALVCAGGAFLVVRDGSGAALSGDLLALASAVFSGFAVNFVRRASAAGENPFVLYLSPCLFGLPLLAFAPGPGPLIHSGAAGLLLLFAVGFGAEKPIADNRTNKGREQNRRVEFIILEQSDGGDAKGKGASKDKGGEKGGEKKEAPADAESP